MKMYTFLIHSQEQVHSSHAYSSQDLLNPEDMERKYRNEIHCNEIVLLAYYIADVNIEAVYHDLMKPDHYVNYDGICLTDTFQLAETKQQSLSQEFFKENSEGVFAPKESSNSCYHWKSSLFDRAKVCK